MKYAGHESFSIRKNWLQKGIRNIEAFRNKTKGEEELMDKLGIGRNMVHSLRYWLKATALVNDDPKKHVFELTDFGKLVEKHDPYIQELGTLFFIHLNLAKNKDFATSWYFLFNEFNMTEFSEKDFCLGLEKWNEMNSEKSASASSFVKDFDCIRHTYIQPKKSRDYFEMDPESNMECPLSELELLKFGENSLIQKSVPSKKKFPPLVLFASILDWKREKGIEQNEIKLSDIQNAPLSPGKIFNMDSILLMSLLGDLENKGFLSVVRTAGLDVVRIKKEKEKMTFEDIATQYYTELGND